MRALWTVLAVHRQGDSGGGIRPVKSFFLADFVMRRANTRSRRHNYVGNEFVGPQIVFTLLLGLGDDKEFLHRNFPRAAWADDPDLRVVGNQYRSNGGWTHEKSRTVVAENRVVAIVALEDQRFAVFLRQQTVAARKYQQRGRWQRFPPMVATLRICGLAASPAAAASIGCLCWAWDAR